MYGFKTIQCSRFASNRLTQQIMNALPIRRVLMKYISSAAFSMVPSTETDRFDVETGVHAVLLVKRPVEFMSVTFSVTLAANLAAPNSGQRTTSAGTDIR